MPSGSHWKRWGSWHEDHPTTFVVPPARLLRRTTPRGARMNAPVHKPSTDCPYELWDGAYVLGSLSPAERREFEAHLDGCRTCSRSLRDLAGLPGLLGRIGPEVFEESEPEPVPETLLPRLSRAVRREQKRRPGFPAVLAAAAHVAIAPAGVAVFDRHSSDATATPTA